MISLSVLCVQMCIMCNKDLKLLAWTDQRTIFHWLELDLGPLRFTY